MGWIRISDDFYDHEKFSEVGPLGISMWLAGLAYCNRNLTNGSIPHRTAERLIHFGGVAVYVGAMGGRDASAEDAIGELIDAGLWTDDGKRFHVHDYLTYQPSKDEVTAQRQKNAFRQAQFKKRKRDAEGGDEDAN